MPLIALPSGACIRPDKISFIARKGLNHFMVVFHDTGVAVDINGDDMDILRGLGVVQSPELEKSLPPGSVIEVK